MTLTIKTNNVPRDLLNWDDLTEEEKKQFDYYKGEDKYFALFFRYKENAYDSGEFSPAENFGLFRKWDGYESDTYFSGVVIRFVEDNERVIVGRYYC